jgi:hypothetical protein
MNGVVMCEQWVLLPHELKQHHAEHACSEMWQIEVAKQAAVDEQAAKR